MKPILSLAIGLVMVTITHGIGLFIWLIPAITVAAGLAPRGGYSVAYDPVAVSAMVASSPLPFKDGNISKEVAVKRCFRFVRLNFAIAAVHTGGHPRETRW